MRHLLLQNLIVFLASVNDPFTSLGALNAKDLLEAVSLFFVRGLAELHFTDRLGGRLLLQNLHKFHVQLVTAPLNCLLSLSGAMITHSQLPIRPTRQALIDSTFAIRRPLRVESLAIAFACSGECLSLFVAVHHETLAHVVCLRART